MRTRISNFPNNSNVTIPRRQNRGRAPNVVEPELRTMVEVAPMVERTMEELLRAPTEGYGEAIVLPEINADHLGDSLKPNCLQLVQANPFHGYERENPHAHINGFKRITSTLRFRDVPNDVIKLMMFPYSLEGATKVWYEKEPPNSILTWEDLVTKFVNQIFPPSKTTHLKNEISCFTQKFEETFSEAWERFKEMLRACPHHGFTEMNTTSRESVSKTNERIDKLADQLSTLVEIVSKKVVTPAPVKAVEELCVTCRFQNQPFQVPNNQVQQEFSNEFSSYKRTNDQMMRNMQNQINSLKGEVKNEIQNTMKTQQAVLMNQQNVFQTNLQNMLSGFFQNQASTSGTLPSNTIPNPKGEMKAITTRSGVAYEGPSIPTNPSPQKVVEREAEETTDKEQNNFQGSTAHIPPPVNPISNPEPDVPKTLPKPNIPYPSRRNDQKFREKASNKMEKIFKIFQDLRFDISFADALLLMPRFAPTIKNLLMNKEKLFELAKIPLNENCSGMLLKKLPEKLRDPGKFLIPCDFLGMDVNMDDPNITMEEYIRLEEEKARRNGKVYNWETATYGRIWDDDEVHNLRSVETEFLGIVFDDTLSFDESDDEDYMVIFDKNSFSYKIISVDNLKTDSENDNDKVNMPSLPSPEPTVSYFDDLDYLKNFENEFPAIVYNDALTSKSDFLTEPIIIYPDGLKSDEDNDCKKIDTEQPTRDIFVIPTPDMINTDVCTYAQGLNKLLKANMALLPRDQRHQYRRFEGLEYTDADFYDFEERLGRIYSIRIHRMLVLDFESLPTIMSERFSEAIMDIDAEGMLQFQLGGVETDIKEKDEKRSQK
ncbi:reverse transcriptase domain-containing protein [Tanacetum coccineum]